MPKLIFSMTERFEASLKFGMIFTFQNKFFTFQRQPSTEHFYTLAVAAEISIQPNEKRVNNNISMFQHQAYF